MMLGDRKGSLKNMSLVQISDLDARTILGSDTTAQYRSRGNMHLSVTHDLTSA